MADVSVPCTHCGARFGASLRSHEEYCEKCRASFVSYDPEALREYGSLGKRQRAWLVAMAKGGPRPYHYGLTESLVRRGLASYEGRPALDMSITEKGRDVIRCRRRGGK